MTKITGIIIAKNEEERIADCIDSLFFCYEIIVVDGGSSDNTMEIAKRIGALVFSHKTDNFSSMRNVGLQKANMEWVLYVDADERVSKELSQEINRLISNSDRDNKLNGYFLKRKNFYFGNYEWPYVEKIARLFKKRALKGWHGQLHESPIVNEKLGELKGFLLHYTHRDLSSMVTKTNEWSGIEAQLRLQAGHPSMSWWRFFRVMFTAFFNSYIRQGGWKVGTVGLIESVYQSFSMFITYAKLWEMQNEKEQV